MVPYDGPKTAKICIVGEAPGADEVKAGKPFVGKAGRRLMNLLNRVGLCREDVLLANVCRYRPERNKFAEFWIDKKQTVPTKMLEGEIQTLKNFLLGMPNLELVICLGRQAMFVLSGLDGIMKQRGTILDYASLHNIESSFPPKILFTLHPSFLLRNPAYDIIVLMDLKKGLRNKDKKQLLSDRQMVIYPTEEDWKFFQDRAYKSKNPLSVDIETAGNQITRIGMCVDLEYAISIPFRNVETGVTFHNDWMWPGIQELLSRKQIVGQNFINYDLPWLESYGCHFPNFIFDTMIAQHNILPGLPKLIKPLSLAFLASIYTNEPYYKDEAKKLEGRPPKDNVYGLYNIKDVFTTLETYSKQIQHPQLKKQTKIFNFETKLARTILHDLTERGVKIDVVYRASLKKRAEKECEYLSLKLAEKTGIHINLASPKQIATLLYTDLKLKPITKKNQQGKVVVTTNEDALKTLKYKYKKYRIPELEWILKYRKVEQPKNGILSVEIDKDNRIRCAYKQDTSSGRLASTSSPRWTGQSLHVIPRDKKIRKMFLPNNELWVHRDLSQAEAWLTYYEAGADRMLQKMKQGLKPHQLMASIIGGKKYEEVKKGTDEYAMGKEVVHESNYLAGPRTLANTIRNKLDIHISQTQAKQYQEAYYRLVPEIPVWHLRVLHELKVNNLTLRTCLGRERRFFGFFDGTEKGSNELLRQAVSYKPQSTIGDLLNLIILKWEELKTVGTLIVPVHDETNTSCSKKERKKHLEELDVAFNYPITIGKYKDVVIPWETTIQKNWGG